MLTDGARARCFGSAPLGFAHPLSLPTRSSSSRRHAHLCSHARAMEIRVFPLSLLGLLFAYSWILFAAASPVRLSANLWVDKSSEGTNSSSGSFLKREVAVPRYQRCKQKRRFAMTFDDGPVRLPEFSFPLPPRCFS